MNPAYLTAVVLAGGVGKRFQPFITDKTLFPFMNKSLLERTVQNLADAGIKHIIVATNADNHRWLAANKHQLFPNVEIKIQRQAEPQGMGDALLALKDTLPQRDILVTNAGDMVDHRLITDLIAHIKGQYAVVTGMVTPTYQPLGYFELDENENVIAIKEKPGSDGMPSNVANLVFHYFSDPQKFLQLIAQASQNSNSDDIYEQALTELLAQHEVGLFRYRGSWQKLKYGYHVLDMSEFFLRELAAKHDQPQIHPDASVASTAVIKGPVVIAANAKIFDQAVIQGPCYIGSDTIIGNHALIRSSLVEEGAVIGYGSEIVRSYIGPQCDLHHVYIGDSVLEAGVHFGFNAHTTNLRFDRQPVSVKLINEKQETNRVKLGALIAKGSEIGANTTLMPGVTVGSNSLVHAGLVMYEPLADDQILKLKQETVTSNF